MKTITAHARNLILDARSEGLTSLPPGILEKDLLITEVLRIITTLGYPGVGLVFCGGTCLSKAYHLIKRMSEDIDFKLVVPEGLSRSACRGTLSQLKSALIDVLEQAGFVVPGNEIICRDENKYIALNLHYNSLFDPVVSLRPEIKVELSARAPAIPTAWLSVGTLLEVLVGNTARGQAIECISVEETLAEKVLSFLRRTAEASAGRNREAYDDRLARHLYDVRAIVHERQDLILPHDQFARIVLADADKFRNQFPEFAVDPVEQMVGVLEALLQTDSDFERDYGRFVEDLVFGEPVSFAEARDVFCAVARDLVNPMQTLARGNLS